MPMKQDHVQEHFSGCRFYTFILSYILWCVCQDGFTSVHCGELAGCLNFDSLCSEREYCQNTPDWYTCKCLPGFHRSTITDRCEPCSDIDRGNTCSETCNCHPQNTIMCDQTQVKCICSLGWEGGLCDVSVDDCPASACAQGVCQDAHRGYVCKCPMGYTMILGECLKYRTDFIASNYNPNVGELVDVYILFQLPSLYRTNVLLGPDFQSTLVVDKKSDECTVSLHKHSWRVFGDESFLNVFNKKQRKFVEYQYYSSYKVRFLKEGRTTLTVLPYSKTTHAMKITFSVQYRSRAVRECLENMFIEGASPFPEKPEASKYHMKRQFHNTMRAKFNQSKPCKETKHFQWSYSSVNQKVFKDSEMDKRNYCMFEKYFSPIDIIDISRKGPLTLITDHMSEVETIPKEALALGIYLVCVSAYIQNDTKSSASACGFINIVHSRLILGSIYPRRSVVQVSQKNVLLESRFWDPDDPVSDLQYVWTCDNATFHDRAYCRKGRSVIGETVPIRQGGDLERDVCIILFPVLQTLCIVNVSSIYNAAASDNIVIRHRHLHNLDFDVDIRCEGECLGPVPLTKNFNITSVGSPGKIEWTLKPDHTTWEKLQKVTYNWNSGQFTIKTNFLKPNSDHILVLSFLEYSYLTNYTYYAEFKFSMAGVPTRGSCELKPSTGNLVNTRFTFKCKGYTDPDGRPVLLRLYQKELIAWSELDVLIGYSSTGSIPDLSLSRFVDVNVTGGEQVAVKLLWDVGTPTEILYKTQRTYTLTLEPVLDVSDVLDPKSEKHMQRTSQENLRRHKDIATMMNLAWTRNITNVNFALIRQQLLKNLNNKERSMSLFTIRQKTVAMRAILEKDVEILSGGLVDGTAIMTDLVRHNHLFYDDFDVFWDIFWIQLQCLDRLLTVVHDMAKYYLSHPGVISSRGLLKTKAQSIKLTDALTYLGKSQVVWKPNPYGRRSSDKLISLEVTSLQKDQNEYVSTNLGYMFVYEYEIGHPRRYLLYQELKKSPYVWASDEVFNDFPLLDVRFFKKDSDMETGHFRRPATVTFYYQLPKPELKEIPLNLVVNAMNKTIVVSECVTMTLAPLANENTVLEVTSPDYLTMKVQTSLSSDFLYGTSDEELKDLPDTSFRDVWRQNIIHLPRISSRRILNENENYRVRITIKKGQRIGRAKLHSPSDQSLKLLLQDNMTEIYRTKIIVSAYSMSCKYYSHEDTAFRNDICRMSNELTLWVLTCLCSKSGAYTASVRATNSLLDSTNANLEVVDVLENPLVSFMVAAVWVTFMVALFWAKKKDTLDELKNTATILEDTSASDRCVYLVCITTGMHMTSAPSADVFMYIRGTKSSTRPRAFWDREKVTFQPGSDEWFIVTTPEDIGDVTSSVVWTFGRGGEKDLSWHLTTVYIENLLTKEAWVCQYNGWLSRSYDREDIVEIPAINEADLLKDTRAQVLSKCSHDLRNQHLWLGVVGKSVHNRFTRVRRLITILTVVQSLMLLNLMSFGKQTMEAVNRLGHDRQIHMISIFIGLYSSFYTMLIGLIISFLFTRIKNRIIEKRIDAEQQPSASSNSTLRIPRSNSTRNSNDDEMDEKIQFARRISSAHEGSNYQHDVSQNAAEDGEDGENPQSESIEKKEEGEATIEGKSTSYDKEKKPENTEKSLGAEDILEDDGVSHSTHYSSLISTGTQGNETNTPVQSKTKPKKRPSAGKTVFQRFFGREVAPVIEKSIGTKDETGGEKETDEAKNPENANSKSKADNDTTIPETKRPSLAKTMYQRFFGADNVPEKVETVSPNDQDEGIKSIETIEQKVSGMDDTMSQLLQVPHPRLAKLGHENQDNQWTAINQPAHTPTYQQETAREPFSLPWWSIVFLWPLVFAFNIFLSYYIVLYGYSVTYSQTWDWLVAFFTGVLADVLVYQPLLIVFSGCVMVLLFGKKYPYYTRGPLQCLKETRILISSLWKSGKVDTREVKRATFSGQLSVKCSMWVAKDIMRRLRIEGNARQIVRNMIGYSLFLLSALFLINQYMMITTRFWIAANLKRHILNNLSPHQSMNVSSMWNTLQRVVIPALKPSKSESISIENTFLFGTTRLRQVRITNSKGLCEDILDRLVTYYSGILCTQSVSSGEEEMRSFQDSWATPDPGSKTAARDSPFTYFSGEDLEHRYRHIGDHGYYSAGGYIKLIPPDDPFQVAAVLSHLKKTGWIDQFTRCLFFEFTLYNANLNVISGVHIAFEFLNYGAIYPTASFDSSSLMFLGSWSTVIAEVIMCVCILYYTYYAYKEIRENGFNYFSKMWNLMEVSVLLMSFTAIALKVLIYQTQLGVLKKYLKHGNARYTDFSAVFHLEETMQLVLGCLGALVIFKTLQLITFSPFMAKFTKTLEICIPNLAGYLLLTIIYTLAFSCTGRILFGTLMKDYSSFVFAMFAHIRFVLGGPDLLAMFGADWVMGRIFAVLALGVTQYIIINIFISILREGFGLANQMTYREKEATTVCVKNIVLRFFGITQRSR